MHVLYVLFTCLSFFTFTRLAYGHICTAYTFRTSVLLHTEQVAFIFAFSVVIAFFKDLPDVAGDQAAVRQRDTERS